MKPEAHVHIDFEVRSELDLKKVGAAKWLSHSSTDILCVAIKDYYGRIWSARGLNFGGEDAAGVWESLKTMAVSDNLAFVAHNANFEHQVWNRILYVKHDFPLLSFDKWECSAAMAARHSLPRDLLGAGKALGVDAIKDEIGKRSMLRMSKPVPEKFQHIHGKWYESDEDFKELISYCEDDVRAESAIFEKLSPSKIIESEKKLFVLDHKINHRGVLIDKELAESAIKMKESIKEELVDECKQLCGWSPSQVMKLTDWINKKGVKTKNLRSEVIKTLLTKNDVPADVKRVLKIRQDFSTTSLAKYDAALNYEMNSVVREQFLYHGATTGRWTGKGIQLQNLPRGSFDGNIPKEMKLAISLIKAGDLEGIKNLFGHNMSPMEVMKSCLRGLVIARPGKQLQIMDLSQLQVMDFSQIEARVLPWLASQKSVLDAFRNGEDLYKFTAAQIYDTEIEDVTKDQRFIGKTASLALGYQGGAGAFQNMALNFGVKVDDDLAEKIKKDWRERNQKIVSFWSALEEAAMRAIRKKEESDVPNERIYQIVRSKISFFVEDDFLIMCLPSGRKLYYYQPLIEEKEIKNKFNGETWTKDTITHMGSDSAKNIRWNRIWTYGGKLAENATQAVSRDILVEAMLRLDEADYNIIFHCHDEIGCEGVKREGALQKMKEIVEVVPNWAEGLPIQAEGFETDRYYKG